MGRGYVLTIMEVDKREHVNEEKVPPTKKLAAVWTISSLSDCHILGWLEAHEDTASQWLDAIFCHPKTLR